MRYDEEHKAKTRQRIIEEAARRFRRDGVNATSVQTLMKALKLTHGGFYGHFASKDELIDEALRHCLLEIGAVTPASLTGDWSLPEFIQRYLSTVHRDEPARGCIFPTVSAELGQRGEAHPATDQALLARLGQLGEHLPDPQDAVLVLSALVGALVLSRGVVDPELSDRVLDGARTALLELLEAKSSGA
ncbi:TetR/AcrR family transcriptional regulator [Pseudomonas sp. Snoq117.2]|uniref:TetR/AcrR family transcriptional regulator n=1 Tax=Pseudomonas sp. Snoq117.2 TaxID=1500302 RepID=UPI0008C064DB|nr:TetR/AcrR family transcriptional regulator [Pseudomonas sp. Snoq117.2]SEO92146.1 transcriptional regulator, TetR family [Pseudomonas sp. Snoq117.2]